MNVEIPKVGDIKSKLNIGNTIKSLYNLKEILNFLDEKIKCEVIIYNKQLQNELGINIEDYKAISGKYKIGEKKGKGKEYIINTNILKFEGEYLNGKRNGKGKEYYNNHKLKFEGEYLNGNRWNGKRFNKNGNVDSEINNGTGKGKEYNKYGELKFNGEYLNGKRNRIGREYFDNGKLKFEENI